MSRTLTTFALASLLAAGGANADALRVATDIAPVHSLVARVMGETGRPDLVIAPGATPHAYSLRPSEAAALANADVVFWIGAPLTPWLERALETLADGARVRPLLDTSGTERLAVRDSALFDAHDHDHDHGEAGHDHAGHDHAGDDHAGHDDAGHDDAGHDGHDRPDAVDPHAWLSPANARNWLDVIAADLAAADPSNTAVYAANAAAAKADLDSLSGEIDSLLAPYRGTPFVAFHDAYQYFERAFDMPASGAIAISDASPPSPARLAEIRQRIRDDGIACVLSEPQFNAGVVASVMEGTGAGTAVADPLGMALDPGPELYPALLLGLATTLSECL